MDLTSPYFPIRVKQEPLDETYEPSGYHTGLYSNSYGNIKQENRDAYSHTIAEADSASLALESVTTSKKRIRKKKNKQTMENGSEYAESDMGKTGIKQEKISETFKERKKVDRFNGMPEEEVVKRTLPDHLVPNLDVVVIGINPGLFAAYKGHHYAGPGNHFWKCLFLSGLIAEPMTSDDDFKLIEYGIGFTNIVARTTRGSADLTRKEIRDGATILLEKLQKYKPKIAVFNGKGIYEVFSGKKNFDFGKQPDFIENTSTVIFVMPSSSARCAQLPRAIDKVPFYEALKKLRDHLIGKLPNLQESEVTFPDVKLKIESDDGIKAELLEIKEENCDRQLGNMMHNLSNGLGEMQAQSSIGDSDVYSKAKKYKKKSKKKKSDDEDSSPSSQLHPQQSHNHPTQSQPSQGPPHPHHHQVMGQQQSSMPPQQNAYLQGNYPSDPFTNPPAPMAMRVKQEKSDELMYGGYGHNQQQQQQQQQAGCNYGGYPPPAHSGSYYGSPSGGGSYGSYAPPPSHPPFVSSGSLNQLESFVDQIPNIGPSMVPALPAPPPAHGASYPPAGQAPVGPHYAQGSMTYPPPPPAHEHQINSSSYSPHPPAMGYSFPGADPPPAHSPTFVGSQSYCPDNYQPRSPVYTDLDSVQVKQERLDPAYGTY